MDLIGTKCKKGREIDILMSGAGYYIGTLDEDGAPYCRISSKYAATYPMAKELDADRQFGCIENEHCNGGKGCFPESER